MAGRRCKMPENVTLLPLPYSPELNPVERVWLYMRERYLSSACIRAREPPWTRSAPLGIQYETRLDGLPP